MGTSVRFGLPVCLSASLQLKGFSPDVALEADAGVGGAHRVITGKWTSLLLFDCLSRGCLCFVTLLNDDLNISLRNVTTAHSTVRAQCHHFVVSKAFRLFKAKKVLRLARVLQLRTEHHSLHVFEVQSVASSHQTDGVAETHPTHLGIPLLLSSRLTLAEPWLRRAVIGSSPQAGHPPLHKDFLPRAFMR